MPNTAAPSHQSLLELEQCCFCLVFLSRSASPKRVRACCCRRLAVVSLHTVPRLIYCSWKQLRDSRDAPPVRREVGRAGVGQPCNLNYLKLSPRSQFDVDLDCSTPRHRCPVRADRHNQHAPFLSATRPHSRPSFVNQVRGPSSSAPRFPLPRSGRPRRPEITTRRQPMN